MTPQCMVHIRLATCLCLSIVTPEPLCFQVPFSILVWGSCKGSPLTMACHVPVMSQTMQAHVQYLHISIWDGFWDHATM